MANGVIIAIVANKPTFATKAIKSTIEGHQLPAQLLKLANWISAYYATHLALVLQAMLPSGLQKQRREQKNIASHPIRKRTQIVLNSDQAAAVQHISTNCPGTFLLHGVTGSGKTQVYIETAKQELADGGCAIILVPEIALTPQLVAEFALHFPNLIVTHSRLTEAKRHAIWLQAQKHNTAEPLVIIGPRSALFLPASNVKIIIIDECHEPSYKQDQSPKYSALRAASVLASAHNAKLILGSATPSIADYYLASQGGSPILQLPTPAAQLQPINISIVDLKLRTNFTQHRFLSNELLAAIDHTLASNQQVLLFHNRRGTAPTTLCEQCGWTAHCPLCFLPLTLHADKHSLVCHLCGYSAKVQPSCPECHEPTIIFKGIGTKLIESEIAKRFPKARIARFDADTSEADALHTRYQDLYDGNIDIIIGTQIIAKGLDIPKLSLVGVVQADSGLVLPDYTSNERVFQLLYQVIGRAGRGEHKGNVIIQTYQPEHETIQQAVARDYGNFYVNEITKREQAMFPPFCHLLKLTCSYKTEAGAINASRKLAQEIRNNYSAIIVLGPTPAFHERLGGAYRWQIVIKSKQRATLASIAQNLPTGWMSDLDPSTLL